jgi:hypothetical protein
MLESYYDESESSIGGKPILVIAGYIAQKDSWSDFGVQWQHRILDKYHVSHLHAKKLRSRSNKLYRHLTFEQRSEIITTAIELIGSYTESAFSIYMRPCDWKQATTAQERSGWGSCYGMCTEILLAAMSENGYGGASPKRVSVFIEDGHSNAEDALRHIRFFKHDSEPVEWPELAEEEHAGYVDPIRNSCMRIGAQALVPKIGTPQVQAADLLAHLIGSNMQKTSEALFSGALDKLLNVRPVVSSGWGPESVAELAAGLRTLQESRKAERGAIWHLKKQIRGTGARVYELPWGIVIDKAPGTDELSDVLKEQVNEILGRFETT